MVWDCPSTDNRQEPSQTDHPGGTALLPFWSPAEYYSSCRTRSCCPSGQQLHKWDRGQGRTLGQPGSTGTASCCTVLCSGTRGSGSDLQRDVLCHHLSGACQVSCKGQSDCHLTPPLLAPCADEDTEVTGQLQLSTLTKVITEFLFFHFC